MKARTLSSPRLCMDAHLQRYPHLLHRPTNSSQHARLVTSSITAPAARPTASIVKPLKTNGSRPPSSSPGITCEQHEMLLFSLSRCSVERVTPLSLDGALTQLFAICQRKQQLLPRDPMPERLLCKSRHHKRIATAAMRVQHPSRTIKLQPPCRVEPKPGTPLTQRSALTDRIPAAHHAVRDNVGRQLPPAGGDFPLEGAEQRQGGEHGGANGKALAGRCRRVTQCIQRIGSLPDLWQCNRKV